MLPLNENRLPELTISIQALRLPQKDIVCQELQTLLKAEVSKQHVQKLIT